MNIDSTLLAVACSCALLANTPTEGIEVMYRSPAGTLNVIDIPDDASFNDAIQAIGMEWEPNEFSSTFGNTPFTSEYLVDFMSTQTTQPVIAKSISRDYTTPISSDEKKQINYVIETLGNSSLIAIARMSSALEKAGKEVDHIHPLQFLGYIFSNEKLKAAMHSIRDRGWIWDKFSKGVKSGLEEEANNNNPPSSYQDFLYTVENQRKKSHPACGTQELEGVY